MRKLSTEMMMNQQPYNSEIIGDVNPLNGICRKFIMGTVQLINF